MLGAPAFLQQWQQCRHRVLLVRLEVHAPDFGQEAKEWVFDHGADPAEFFEDCQTTEGHIGCRVAALMNNEQAPPQPFRRPLTPSSGSSHGMPPSAASGGQRIEGAAIEAGGNEISKNENLGRPTSPMRLQSLSPATLSRKPELAIHPRTAMPVLP